MKITLLASIDGAETSGEITPLLSKDIPSKKDGWQFNWRSLYKTEGSWFYKIKKLDQQQIEGLLMLTLLNDEMLFLNNVEVAPWNYGKKGKYSNIAGCLLAFACKKSLEFGRNHYNGFLSFESKAELIDLYIEKYGATLISGQKMFFDPIAGKRLINIFLSEKTNY